MGSIARPLANHHISVDCVVVGFDGRQLKVLLVKRDTDLLHDMKLPGSLIYEDEDLDEAAKRALYELTGLKIDTMVQLKAFGSKDRTKNPLDRQWLERAIKQKVGSIVTVAYVTTVRSMPKIADEYQAEWIAVNDIKELAFDHNQIISEALLSIRNRIDTEPIILFRMLPAKFTALQLRTLYELFYNKEIDVRNFHKKIAVMSYVLPLDEYEKDVSHRAARYYKFDKKQYNRVYKLNKSFNR